MATQHPSDFQLPYTEYALNGQNGRINFSTVTGGPEGAGGTLNVPGFDYGKKAEANFVGDMLRGNMTPSEVAMAFFTTCNVETIQQAIRREVYIRSGPKKYTIDDQDVDELKMVMRAMYLQYAKNNQFNIEGQINELNELVVKWSAPSIMSEIEQYNYYINYISHLPIPLQQPMNMSSAGTRSLPFQPQM